jgi:AbrB family looped-hinge helix DNA binding protein
MSDTTTATIDRAGRLVIPKAIRVAAGLQPGQKLLVALHDEGIDLRPLPRPVTLEKRRGVLVAVPVTDSEPLTAETVEAVRGNVRRRGGR